MSAVRRMLRVVTGAIAGAVLAAAALVIAVTLRPGFAFDMDRPPVVIRGLYDVERAGQDTFAWTGRQAVLDLPGLDRTRIWSCRVAIRAGRSDAASLPQLTLDVDGITVAVQPTTNERQEIEVRLPPRPARPGATVTMSVAPTFVPGPDDRRDLGVIIDRWSCAPEGGGTGLVRVPPGAILAAATGGAAFGAALALIGLALPLVLLGSVVVSAGQAVALSTAPGLFTPYLGRLPWFATVIASVVAIASFVLSRRAPLSTPARIAIAFTGIASFLRLAALVHPTKQIVDAVFHAHRLEWVLDGRWYFTQPMPSGVSFPYAIGLYLFTWPWTWLTHDYVALLRIVVVAADGLAGGLLYWAIVRTRADRGMAALAVVVFALIPLTYLVMGNANLTNAFGQSVATVAVLCAVVWRLSLRAVGATAALTAIVALALLSHVSTFALLLATLGAMAILYWLRSRDLRQPALAIAVACTIAAGIAVGTYYIHFPEVYERLTRITTPTTQAPSPTAAATTTPASSLATRATTAISFTRVLLGWPVVLLAAIGAVRSTRDPVDRLALALYGWALAYAVFFGVAVGPRVAGPFERYAAEFISRVVLAICPAAAILAARGAAWSWRSGLTWRVVCLTLLGWAAATGIDAWLEWLR